MATSESSKGWRVALAGTGINLALRVLYAWSIFKGKIKSSIAAGGPAGFNRRAKTKAKTPVVTAPPGAFMENFIKGCNAFFFGFAPNPYRTMR